MCGILGLVTGPDPSDAGLVERCSTALQNLGHRGPDDRGEYRDASVWLAHTRLSILDLSPAGHQPMQSHDGRHTISYNGEVYNYRELADELGLRDLRSHSDTEVVLRAFAARGVSSFPLLNGMFAFAVYDKVARRLWLVRDRLGIKPLYYSLTRGGLAFASEIRSLLDLTGLEPTCDLSAVNEWQYYGNSLGGRTLIRGLEQLPPAHYLEFDLDTCRHRVGQYWSVRDQAHRRSEVGRTRADLVGETRRLLENSVRRQLVSDVPVGVFLSGGVDSSAITAFAARHYGSQLSTFSAGFDYRGAGDERPKARRVARLFGTDHHEFEIRGGDVSALVEKMVDHHGVPFFDAANIPLYRMAMQVRESTKVILQGDGGDEVFGGYRRYVTLRLHPLLHRIAPAARRAMRLAGLPPRLRQRGIRYMTAYAADDVGTTMGLLLTQEGPGGSATTMFNPTLAAEISPEDPLRRYRACQREVADLDVGNQMSLVDLQVILPDIYLEKVDRATMAASLEVRVPFLDHELVDYVVGVPGTAKMPWGRKKWLLKQAMDGILPADVLYGPKTGFGVPFGHWLKTSLRDFFHDQLNLFVQRRPGVLRPDVVEGWYSDYVSGKFDHSDRLWKVLNLLVWCNRFRVRFDAVGMKPMGPS